MANFGIYIHIPYCLQKCHYCDFTTLDFHDSSANHNSPAKYVEGLLSELRNRAAAVRAAVASPLTSIYFGGGTPSLLPAKDILAVLTEIANQGFVRTPDCEITIEINPGTIDSKKLDLYLAAGVNRFSVGVQTFRDDYLKVCGREHSADSSRQTLRLLRDAKVNYSFDLLFGLPGQSLADLAGDLEELIYFEPPHVSLYNLTIPEHHAMNAGRATDEDQAQMFEVIESRLREIDVCRYEISNFSRFGFESRHNKIYWTGGAYWGLGISAHSYLPAASRFGTRFWNSRVTSQWLNQIAERTDAPFWHDLPVQQFEALRLHEALTDFFHTRLRQTSGFDWDDFERFTAAFNIPNAVVDNCRQAAHERIDKLRTNGLLSTSDDRVTLTHKGYPLTNSVFRELTFLSDEIPRH